MTMEMRSGDELERALRSGELGRSQVALSGMIKPGEQEGYISFTSHDCSRWIALPTSLIEGAQELGEQACRDHRHPRVLLTLKVPHDPAAQALHELLRDVQQLWAASAARKRSAAATSSARLPIGCHLGCLVEHASCLDGPLSPGTCGMLETVCNGVCDLLDDFPDPAPTNRRADAARALRNELNAFLKAVGA